MIYLLIVEAEVLFRIWAVVNDSSILAVNVYDQAVWCCGAIWQMTFALLILRSRPIFFYTSLNKMLKALS